MLGETIRMLRIARTLTIAAVAACTGIPVRTIENYEAGVWQPGGENLQKLAECFAVDKEEIVHGFSLLFDEDNREIVLVRNVGGNRFRILGRVKDKCHRMEGC